jgi:hypothetical protein
VAHSYNHAMLGTAVHMPDTQQAIGQLTLDDQLYSYVQSPWAMKASAATGCVMTLGQAAMTYAAVDWLSLQVPSHPYVGTQCDSPGTKPGPRVSI